MLNRYLLGVVVEFGVGEADAGTIERDPGAPLHAHHQGAHGEDHPLQAESLFFSLPLSRYRWQQDSTPQTKNYELIVPPLSYTSLGQRPKSFNASMQWTFGQYV